VRPLKISVDAEAILSECNDFDGSIAVDGELLLDARVLSSVLAATADLEAVECFPDVRTKITMEATLEQSRDFSGGETAGLLNGQLTAVCGQLALVECVWEDVDPSDLDAVRAACNGVGASPAN